jgi:hypothetical protein
MVHGKNAELVLAEEERMGRDEFPTMNDLDLPIADPDLDRLPDQRERDRVAIGLEADQVVVGYDARVAGSEAEAGLGGRRDQGRLLLDEAIVGPLVGRPVDPDVGDLRQPLGELFLEIPVVEEDAPGRKLRLKYFTPDLTLPFVWAR